MILNFARKNYSNNNYIKKNSFDSKVQYKKDKCE